jgi:hypothetical protein
MEKGKERKQKTLKNKSKREKNEESQKLKDIVEIIEGQRYNRKAPGSKRKNEIMRRRYEGRMNLILYK